MTLLLATLLLTIPLLSPLPLWASADGPEHPACLRALLEDLQAPEPSERTADALERGATSMRVARADKAETTEGEEGSGDERGTETGIWQRWEQELAPFELTDLQGRTWSRKDLEGRVVLVNLWATWCGPCRLELPHLQKLQERVAQRPKLTVVTLSSDYNPGLIQPFLDEHGYDFPVLLATDHLFDAYGGPALPETWIVDPSGVIRYRQRGFDPDHADTWTEDALRHMETVQRESRDEPQADPKTESESETD